MTFLQPTLDTLQPVGQTQHRTKRHASPPRPRPRPAHPHLRLHLRRPAPLSLTHNPTQPNTMNPTTLTPSQEADLLNHIADLRAMARGLRIEADAPKPRHDDDVRNPMDLANAVDRQADDLARTIAVSRDAERAGLDADLHLARTMILNAHRTGNTADLERATADERHALDRRLAFLNRTTKVVAYHKVRR